MVKIISYLLIAFVALSFQPIFSQVAIGGGFSTMFQFGNSRPLLGANLLVEIPRNNQNTFYGRVSYLAPQKFNTPDQKFEAIAIDPATTPNMVPVNGFLQNKSGYFIIDGGTRYYFLNGYDEGVSIYGGTNLGLIINTVNYGYQIDDYDKERYSLSQYNLDDFRGKGSIISLAIGFTGGVKYTIPKVGSFFLDINPYLLMFGIPSASNLPTNQYKSLLFNFNIGFRKELYK